LSISSVRSRIQEIQAEIKAVRQRSARKFDAVLQDQLSDSATADGDVAAAENGAMKELIPFALPSQPAAFTAEGGVPYENISQTLQNQLAASGNYNPGYAAYNAANAEAAGGLNTMSGSVADYAAGLPAEFAGAAPYMEYIREASARYGMPVNLIIGIMKAESNFNNECVSYAGAKGLMQLMPETAAEVGVSDVFDPRQNILGSVEYVTKLINRYDGDVRLALAAYNTGPGKIAGRGVTSSLSAEYLTVPQSIRDYAERVLKYAGYVQA
jgi:soluble lytic murein transglycosylase-like protein